MSDGFHVETHNSIHGRCFAGNVPAPFGHFRTFSDIGVLALALHAVARIGGEPAPRGDVELRPVVHAVAVALRLPPALPPRRYARGPAHGNEQHALHAAVALVAREARAGETRDRAV